MDVGPSNSLTQNSNDSVIQSLFEHSAYHTEHGALFSGEFEKIISNSEFTPLKGRIQLLFTSPPFALNNKKRYDNKQGEEYKKWLASYGRIFRELLTEDGSLVIELGNAWEPGIPVMSTLALEALLDLKREGNFYLCQQFVVNNPARLPSPAQWVTVKRKRLTDSFTHIWWLSKTPDPKADNRRVLRPYSESMMRLLQRGSYNDGKRPSEHVIGQTSFLKDNGGAIPHNVLKFKSDNLQNYISTGYNKQVSEDVLEVENWLFGQSNLLEYANTSANDPYIRFCKENRITLHPARMHIGVPTFFINFLTDPGDIVMDPFAGSNTTGAAAEQLDRKWLSFEPIEDYIEGSKGRFPLLR
jgi:site-specific DNA-methyltransferase (cytosine-N4-specific)